MTSPRAVIEAVERDLFTPAAHPNVFSGWGVLGVPFQSGHVLALRRYVASPLGPAYTSIWHRDAAGRWTFYSTVAPDCSCARYYGATIDRNVVAPIDLEWPMPWMLQARVGSELTWRVTLRSSPMSRLFNAVTHLLPDRAWRMPAVVLSVGLAADIVFARYHTRRTGRTPNGHRFVMHPRRLWLVGESTARVSGHDLATPGPQAAQSAPDDLSLPERGLVAVTSVCFGTPAMRRLTPAIRYGEPCHAGSSAANRRFDRAFSDVNDRRADEADLFEGAPQ